MQDPALTPSTSGSVAEPGVPVDVKVRYLSSPAAYPDRPPSVAVVETHMSWVFLAGERGYKLKKPVRYPFLDFTTLAAREANCREEVRLNRRLAPETYLGVAALCWMADDGFRLGGPGAVVDWLVMMRRLPAYLMLDRIVAQGNVPESEVDRLIEVLAPFYRSAARAGISPAAYADRFVREQAVNRDVLTRRDFAVDHGRLPMILASLDGALLEDRPLLEDRVRSGRIVEGHGDLRPEHVCLTDPLVLLDCLEFNRELRLVDPFDEIAFLGMECAMLGAFELGPALVRRLSDRLRERPPDRLLALYTAFRAVLRARLALAHLLDPEPREARKWEPLAARYLQLAQEAPPNNTLRKERCRPTAYATRGEASCMTR